MPTGVVTLDRGLVTMVGNEFMVGRERSNRVTRRGLNVVHGYAVSPTCMYECR